MSKPPSAPWWAWPAMLSLDGPLFVLFSRAAVCGLSSVRRADTAFVLSLVWIGYATDRWLDVRHDADACTWRHASAGRHGPWIFAVATGAGLCSLLAGVRLSDLWPEGPVRWWPLICAAILCARWLGLGWFLRSLGIACLMSMFAGWGEHPAFLDLVCVALIAMSNLAAIRLAERTEERTVFWSQAFLTIGVAVLAILRPCALTIASAAGMGLLCVMGAAPARNVERRRALVDAATFFVFASAIAFS
jgi:hypothetical protein